MHMLSDLAKEAHRAMKKAAEQMDAEEAQVEALLEQISESVQMADRRAGMEGVKALLTDVPASHAAFAAMGVPIMCAVLRDDADDLDLVQGALESLLLAMGGPVADDEEASAPPAAVATTHALAQDQANVQLLLALLEAEGAVADDFYVRFWTVQVLARLLSAVPFALQEAVLTRPQGVVRMMDLLREQEVIRNEALLLLITLARSNEEIQKIVAFEGAFDVLFEVITDEGYAHGGVIVQDSVVLLNTLLRGNASNQLMFREAGYIANLHRLLDASPPPDGFAATAQALEHHLTSSDPYATAPHQAPLSQQHAANILCTLDTVLILTSLPPLSAHAAADGEVATRHEMAAMCVEGNHATLAKCETLETLLALVLQRGGAASLPVRVITLRCVARLVCARQTMQDRLSAAVVDTLAGPAPALQAILQRVLTTHDAAEVSAGQEMLAAFCQGNSEGQTALVSTMASTGLSASANDAAFGELLVTALLGGPQGNDLEVCARAATVMTDLLNGSRTAKERALRTPLQNTPPNAHSALLMPCACHQLAAAASHAPLATPTARLLRLLIAWLHECPPAVEALLSEGSHLPLLVDLLQGRLGGVGGPLVAGLAATVLACCLLYNESSSGLGQVAILDVLTERIGLREFFVKLEELEHLQPDQASEATASKQELSRNAVSQLTSDDPEAAQRMLSAFQPPDSPLDADFTAFLRHFVPAVKREALRLFSQPRAAPLRPNSQGADASANGPADASALQQEVEELQARNAALAQQLMAVNAASGSAATAADPQASIQADMRASRLAVEKEVLQREVALAREGRSRLEHEVAESRARADEVTELYHKLDADLSSLSEAYTALEQDAFQKEGDCRRVEQELAALRSSQAAAAGAAVAPAALAQQPNGEPLPCAQCEELQAELDDLLVCLGQEEQKVAILSENLEGLGVDAGALIADIGMDDDGDGDSVGGGTGVDVDAWIQAPDMHHDSLH